MEGFCKSRFSDVKSLNLCPLPSEELLGLHPYKSPQFSSRRVREGQVAPSRTEGHGSPFIENRTVTGRAVAGSGGVREYPLLVAGQRFVAFSARRERQVVPREIRGTQRFLLRDCRG